MPDPSRPHDVTGLTVGELERARRELQASLALARPGGRGDIVNLTPGQVDRISELSSEWSFFWDKRRALWLAAEDSPDGEQVEEANLDALLARLPAIALRHAGWAGR